VKKSNCAPVKLPVLVNVPVPTATDPVLKPAGFNFLSAAAADDEKSLIVYPNLPGP